MQVSRCKRVCACACVRFKAGREGSVCAGGWCGEATVAGSTRANVCARVCLRTRTADNRDALGKLGCVSAVLRLLRAHAADNGCAEAGCWALRNLSTDHGKTDSPLPSPPSVT